MRSLTVTFPTLSRDLNPHAKGHWRKKYNATKLARDNAHILGLASRGENNTVYPPYFEKASVSLTLYADTKLVRARKCYVPEDIQNLIAAVKPHIDGLKDAGWVKDDDKSCIVGFDPVNIITGKEAGGKCELVITFTEVSE